MIANDDDILYNLADMIDNEMEVDGEDSIAILQRTWLNERTAPELLEPPADLLESVLELLEVQSSRPATTLSIVDCLYQMDAERIKFIMRSWLRCRLGKIERNWASFWPEYTEEPTAQNLRSRLMPNEAEYLNALSQSLMESLKEGCLGRFPVDLSSLGDPEMLASGTTPVALKPALNAHVICRVRADLAGGGEIVLDPVTRATAVLEANDTFVLQYEVIKDFISSGEVDLI
jgi:GINS complex subunit 4